MWFSLTLHQHEEGKGMVRTRGAERRSCLTVSEIAIVVFCFVSLPCGALDFFVSACLLECTQEEARSTMLEAE